MSKRSDPARWTGFEIATLFSIPLIFIIWAIVVLQSGRDVNVTGIEWNFARTALLGDSFGVIGGVMATAAATFTFLTLQRERAENSRLREREAERDQSEANREAEVTFFQLLDLRNSILNSIEFIDRYDSTNNSKGSRAVKDLLDKVSYTGSHKYSYANAQEAYDDNWELVEDQLGHYLRFTYHIIRFVDERFSNELRRYEYVRLLRGQMSNPEVELIALNSAYGKGSPKMANYVVRYALLHSLPQGTIDELQLEDSFGDGAFDTSRWEALRQKRALQQLSDSQ